MTRERYAGVMSGTSLDGVDAVVARLYRTHLRLAAITVRNLYAKGAYVTSGQVARWLKTGISDIFQRQTIFIDHCRSILHYLDTVKNRTNRLIELHLGR